MKTIALKTVVAPINGVETRIGYGSQISELMRTPADSKGADLDEIRHSIRILDAVEAAKGDVLELEDADFEFMKNKILKTRWPLIDRWVQQFIEDVTNPK